MIRGAIIRGAHVARVCLSSEVRWRDDIASLQKRLNGPQNGSRNIRRMDIAEVLKAHGLRD